MELWRLIRTLHLLGMALFVGGQMLLAFVVVPVERTHPDRGRLRAIARRFGRVTVGAFAVLFATGVALAAHEHRWTARALQLKLGLVALIGVLIAWHARRPAAHAI